MHVSCESVLYLARLIQTTQVLTLLALVDTMSLCCKSHNCLKAVWVARTYDFVLELMQQPASRLHTKTLQLS